MVKNLSSHAEVHIVNISIQIFPIHDLSNWLIHKPIILNQNINFISLPTTSVWLFPQQKKLSIITAIEEKLSKKIILLRVFAVRMSLKDLRTLQTIVWIHNFLKLKKWQTFHPQRASSFLLIHFSIKVFCLNFLINFLHKSQRKVSYYFMCAIFETEVFAVLIWKLKFLFSKWLECLSAQKLWLVNLLMAIFKTL